MLKRENILKNYIGIDIGGMSIKGLIINRNGEILEEARCKTGHEYGGEGIVKNIVNLVNEMLFAQHMLKTDIYGVGIGCPGLIDSKSGIVVFAGNLKLKNFALASEVSDKIGIPVKITNDANAAALGEAKFGAGKKYTDSVFLTLGTGVGGGVVADGKLFEGGSSGGTELGHMVIEYDNGLPCTCGRKGCLECYASATALMRKTREVMIENRDSAMWKTYNLETVSGKTAFDYADEDESAKSVVDWYVEHLTCGIVNTVNIFRPQIIMIGGGVSAQGKNLTDRIQACVDRELYAGTGYAPVKVATATLENRAGAYGAAALFM